MASVFKLKGKWYIWWWDHSVHPPKRRKKAGYRDKKLTEQLARKLEDESRAVRDGVLDPGAAERAKERFRPLAEHVDAFIAHLEAKDDAPGHVRQQRYQLERLIAEAKLTGLADLTPGRIEPFLNGLRAGGRSPATVNRYRSTARAFTRMLTRRKVLAHDPLADLPELNEAATRRRRRALSEADLAKLLAADLPDTVKIPKRMRETTKKHGTRLVTRECSVTIPHRRELYTLAACTGLRAAEITRAELDGRCVTVDGRWTKNGLPAVQPIPEAVAEALRPVMAIPDRFGPARRARTRLAAVLRADLARAGVDPEGADFHALRHTYITRLARAGVHPKTAQELARHSDIRLTMQVYTHAGREDLLAAVDKLAPVKAAG